MRILFSLILYIFLCGCGQENTQQLSQTSGNAEELSAEVVVFISETERLNQWFDDRYEEELARSPMTATFLGRKDNYDQVDDVSEAAEVEALQWRGQTVVQLQTDFDYSALTEDGKISYDLWIYQYQSALEMAPFRRHAYVFEQMGGAHASLPTFLINFHRVSNEADMQAYISRIAGISEIISELLVRAQLSASEGVRPPLFAYEIVQDETLALLAGAPFDQESEIDAPLWADAKRKITILIEADEISDSQARQLLEQVEIALLNNFQPAYAALINWLQSDAEFADERAQGVGSLPGGEAYYKASLFNRTTVNLSADEIHQIGLSEVARIQAEMETIKQQVGFTGSLQDFFNFIKTDKQFFYPDDDEGRQGYLIDSTDLLDAVGDKLPEYFGLLPKAELIVRRVEAFREQDGAAQHYYSGTADGSRPGIYYAHLSDMNSMPKDTMETTAYHEGVPGHHMQISIAQELDGVPEFRKQASFTSYVEGWALYAEYLAKEMGAYTDPYKDFGRLSGEIFRAIRLVVDTGIHAKGWTENDAVNYFKENSSISDGQIRSEVRRYIVWPGQATAYKIGMLKILELRQKAETELGEQFDIRGFHDAVLEGGAVPLPILERLVDNWIAEERRG